jgi:tetrahydromethanopterin S-methyltransferase subunit B
MYEYKFLPTGIVTNTRYHFWLGGRFMAEIALIM